MLEFLLGDKWTKLWVQPSPYILTFKEKYFGLGYCKWHLRGGLKDKS